MSDKKETFVSAFYLKRKRLFYYDF